MNGGGWKQDAWRRVLCGGLALAIAGGHAAGWAQSAGENAASYLEFGTVVALGKKTVDVQIYDERLQRVVQRTFGLGRETRADVVHVGETVEVIYSASTAQDGLEWSLRRLVALPEGVPTVGPAPVTRAATATAASAEVTPTSVATVPARRSVTTGRAGKNAAPASVPAANTAANAALARAAAANAGGAPVQPVVLTGAAPKAVPGVVNVPMGVAAESAGPKTPKVRGVATEKPGEACNREGDWAAQPMTLAVLDFRYPTENEESADLTKTGGGSGTAVADLVYNKLGEQPELALRRGDRQKLYRMDFAGAARLGRQLGVDAVLLGTLAAVDTVSPDPDFPAPTQAYTLRAGVVETCTGQLLYKLTSITCPAVTGTKESVAPGCPGSQVTVKQASSPLANAGAFRAPIENLVAPLLHEGTPAGQIGSAGLVTVVNGNSVTVRLRTGGGVKSGDQVSIHAFRLAKNPSTNTLQRFEDTEIGRVTVQRVSGGMAVGTYAGDVAVKVGDTAEVLTE